VAALGIGDVAAEVRGAVGGDNRNQVLGMAAGERSRWWCCLGERSFASWVSRGDGGGGGGGLWPCLLAEDSRVRIGRECCRRKRRVLIP
jgi:hypothetical protein